MKQPNVSSRQSPAVDLRTRKIVGIYGYHRNGPPYRLWIWSQEKPTAEIDLVSGG